MLAGHGGTVLVGGEAGIGKTTLVEDLSIHGRGGRRVWSSGAMPTISLSRRPTVPGSRSFGSIGRLQMRRCRPLPTFVCNAEELAEGGIAGDASLPQLAEFFFSAVATQRPLLLVLDDLHWFDQASLDFFRYLARQVASQRILLVATYRSDELHRRHPLYTLLPLLVREASAERAGGSTA